METHLTPNRLSLSPLLSPPMTGPSMRDVGPQHYLKEEMAAAREAVRSLDKAVASAKSYREKASRMLEEAHRALDRLEQVRRVGVWERKGRPETN